MILKIFSNVIGDVQRIHSRKRSPEKRRKKIISVVWSYTYTYSYSCGLAHYSYSILYQCSREYECVALSSTDTQPNKLLCLVPRASSAGSQLIKNKNQEREWETGPTSPSGFPSPSAPTLSQFTSPRSFTTLRNLLPGPDCLRISPTCLRET